MSRLSEADTSTPAVVLKLDRNVFHHGGLGIIRSLGRLGVPVYGVHEDRLAPAASSRYLRGRWYWSSDERDPGGAAPGDPERVRDGLIRLADRIGRRAVLIPTDDAGAIFLAEHGEALRERYLFPAIRPELPRRLADKHQMYAMCRERGIPAPDSVLPTSPDEVAAFVDRVGLPVVAKLTQPWQRHDSATPRGTTIVRSRAHLDTLTSRLDARRDGGSGFGRLLLQEYVPGSGTDTDWFFHGYCDERSTCRPGFTGVKDRSYPAGAGLTTFGRAVDNPAIREPIEKLLTDLSYRGIVDVDLRWDSRDGSYRVLDFNPRIGAQFRLFEDAQGLDVARAAYLDLTGQPVPDPAPVEGRRFLVENYDALVALRYRDRGLDLRSWARALREVDETAWFARDDLVPFGLMCLRMAWRAVERPVRRATRPRRQPR
ncbi:MAG TPA: hypothetical protein VF054_05190 [Micromonosporaceae bacterium]